MNPIPRSAAASLAAAVFLCAHAGCSREQPAEAPLDEVDSTLVAGKPTPKPEVALDVDAGRIVLELFPDVAPLHVDQFLDLVSEGFYDGTTFHRVVLRVGIARLDEKPGDDDPSNDGYGGLEDQLLDPVSGPVHRLADVGRGRDLASHQEDLRLEAHAGHSHRVLDAALEVHPVLLGDGVHHLPVRRKRHGPGHDVHPLHVVRSHLLV